MTLRLVDCRYCTRMHSPTFLCPPARRVLDALIEQGMAFNMPTLEFPDLVYDTLRDEPGGAEYILMRQLVIEAGLIPADEGGVCRPALIFTGLSTTGELPRWLLPGNDDDIRRAVKLVADIGDMAIRRAAQQRRLDERTGQ